MKYITNAAIKINGKVYEAPNHKMAMEKALEKGENLEGFNQQRDGLFKTSDNRLITREEAQKEFGIRHSEEIEKKLPKGHKFLVGDLGLYVEQANALSDNGKNEVKYTTVWASPYPEYKNYAIGKNFGHLQKELRFWDWVNWSDCVVFFDVHQGDIVSFLRRNYPEKSVFGAGEGSKLEEDRWLLKKVLKGVELPVQKSVKITGITNLKKFLKDNPKYYVKMNIFRGDMESFQSDTLEKSELRIDRLALNYGPHKEEAVFILEEPIDTPVEIGFDGFFNGVDYGDKSFLGYEYHKNLYIAKVIDNKDMPVPLKETMDKLKPVLSKLDYRGALSTEEKIFSPVKHYFLDICCRLPAPLSSGYVEWIKNFSDVVYKVGKKEPFKLDVPYKYVGAIALESGIAKDDYLRIDIKDHSRVKYKMVCSENGKNYAVKGQDSVCVITVGGNSVDEVINKIKKSVDLVEGDGIDKDDVNGIEIVKEIIKKGEKVGIKFS